MATLAVYQATEKHIMDEIDWFERTPDELVEAFKEDEKWFKSETITPFYTSMLKAFLAHQRFREFDNCTSWVNTLKSFYWLLCDHSHIRGYKMSTYVLNQNNFFAKTVAAVNINQNSFHLFLMYLRETVEHIAVMVSLYNPIILAELPILEKFGMNEPVGFIFDGQAAIANKAIPIQYRNYFENLLQTDQDVIGITEWVNSLPDLTQEDWAQQTDQMNNIGRIRWLSVC